MHQHRARDARRDDEALLAADQWPSGLGRLRVLLVVLHDVGSPPGLGIDHVAAPRNGGGCPACLLVPVAFVAGDVGNGGQFGQLRRDRGAALGTEEDGHLLVVVLRPAASHLRLAARSRRARRRCGSRAC